MAKNHRDIAISLVFEKFRLIINSHSFAALNTSCQMIPVANCMVELPQSELAVAHTNSIGFYHWDGKSCFKKMGTMWQWWRRIWLDHRGHVLTPENQLFAVVDTLSNRIQVFTLSGEFIRQWLTREQMEFDRRPDKDCERRFGCLWWWKQSNTDIFLDGRFIRQ